MFSIFSRKDNINDAMNILNELPLKLLDNEKEEFPEEIALFLATVSGGRVTTILSPVLVVLTIVYCDIPKKTEKKLRIKLSEQNQASELIADRFIKTWIETEKDFLAENTNPSIEDFNTFLAHSLGEYICEGVESTYRNNGEMHTFTEEFTHNIGWFLLETIYALKESLK